MKQQNLLRIAYLIGIFSLLTACSSSPSDTGWFRNREFDYLHQTTRTNPDIKIPQGMKSPEYQPRLKLPSDNQTFLPTKKLNLEPPRYHVNYPYPKSSDKQSGKANSSTAQIGSQLQFDQKNHGLLTIDLPFDKAIVECQKALKSSGYEVKKVDVSHGLIEFANNKQSSNYQLYLVAKNEVTQVVVMNSHHQIQGGSQAYSLLKQIQANLI